MNVALILGLTAFYPVQRVQAEYEQDAVQLQKAVTCMAKISLAEASVLGGVGMMLTDTTIINRARQIKKRDFVSAICAAAKKQHRSARNGKLVGDFATKITFDSWDAYQRALQYAKDIAFDALSRTPLLPPQYTFFNSFGPKRAAEAAQWEQNNDVMCDVHLVHNEWHTDFCQE